MTINSVSGLSGLSGFSSVFNALTRGIASPVTRATNLENMTDAQKHELAAIIKKGPSNLNRNHDLAIRIFNQSDDASRSAFLNDPVVQRKLLKGWMTGDVREPDIIKGLQTCTPGLNSEEQKQILYSKFEFFLTNVQNHPETILACRFFNDEKAQQAVAQICEYCSQYCVEHLASFTDPVVQQIVAKAIAEKYFGNNPDVYIALIKQLAIFTDKEAQQTIAKAIDAIDNKCFGNDPDVRTALAGQLGIFTRPKAQRIIAEVICGGVLWY